MRFSRPLFAAVVMAGVFLAAFYSARMGALRDHLDLNIVWAILLSQLISLVSYAILGIRLMLICEQPIGRWSAGFDTVVASIGLNAILPLRLAEVARPFLLAKFARLRLSSTVSVILVERVTDVVALGMIAAIALRAEYSSIVNIDLIYFISASFICIIVTFYFLGDKILHVIQKRTNYIKSRRALYFLIDCISGLVKAIHSRNFIPMMIMAFFGWFSSIMMVYLLLLMGGSRPVTLIGASFVFLCTLIGGTIAVLPAAAGTFHAAGIGGLLILGYSPLESAILATALHVQAFFFPVLYSLWKSLVGSWNFADLKSEISHNIRRL